jgi:hypothetical protein
MKEKIFAILFALIFAGCSDKKIEITPEYIINENWSKKNDEGGGNSIKIDKMRVKKDSIINPFSDLDNADILNKLEEDSLFRWFANVKIEGKSYKDKKIYFNQDNGFTWLDDVERRRTKIFGNLEKDNWYKFSHLISYPYYVYIYVDSSNKVHRFDVNLANY